MSHQFTATLPAAQQFIARLDAGVPIPGPPGPQGEPGIPGIPTNVQDEGISLAWARASWRLTMLRITGR
jgi:hypothetical protein